MRMGGGAVLFFADDGGGLAGDFDRGRFFDEFALGDGVFGSAAAFAAFLDALELPLLLPENEALLRLYFLGVVLLVFVIVTKFAGRGEGVRGTKNNMCSYQNPVDLRIRWVLQADGNLLNEQVHWISMRRLSNRCPPGANMD